MNPFGRIADLFRRLGAGSSAAPLPPSGPTVPTSGASFRAEVRGEARRPPARRRRKGESEEAYEEEVRSETFGSHEEAFVYFGEWFFPVSSNVTAFSYRPENETLVVWYRGVAFYEYYHVGVDEARSAIRAASAGVWVWDRLRIRGTKCGHRKAYVYLSALSSWRAKHPC